MLHSLAELKTRILSFLRTLENKKAVSTMTQNQEMWQELNSYLIKTKSTGCNMLDYMELYREIRLRKPKEVLECGTGVSTLVIAHALMENGRQGSPGRVTSMEESAEYYEIANTLMPSVYRPWVDLVCSPTVEDTYLMFRGMRYGAIPPKDYDFVFVDGPSYRAPSDGALTFDYDFIHVVKNSRGTVYGLCDKRVSTVYVLQQIFGASRIRYDARKHLGYFGPCRASDLKDFDPIEPSKAFSKSFNVFGSSPLRLNL